MRWLCPVCDHEFTRKGTGGHVRYCSVTTEQLFWMKVDKVGDGGCWLWTGAKRWDGYGRLQIPGRQLTAHRYSWELAEGPIPDGMHVLHYCDTPGCVNPGHLWLGSHDDNMRDRSRKNRVYRGGNKPKVAAPDNSSADKGQG